MKTRAFQQVDVFTAVPYRGNPVAVVLDGSDLDDAEFQRFAQWTNLSETTFLLPPTEPGADYRIRIFTPGGEMPFAGHPTLGSCRAWLKAGGKPKSTEYIVQQCVTGLVTIRRDGARLAFAAPPLKRTAPSPTMLAKIAHALGLKSAQILAAQQLDNGSNWLGMLLDEIDSVLALTPDHRALKELGVKVGVAAIAQAPSPTQLIARSNREARAFGGSAQGTVDLEVRAFAAATGIEEDPVTGSLNAGLAQWLIADGHMPERYLVGQGQCLGRDGRLSVERDAEGRVWIGGDTVVCIEGAVTL
ncbi:PhzF family phenazine biosynthesis protein [Variovorax rhizosphaerae]|uniref:PhzF family phenazine biosynthesis protein n=1 Tax=Variovorax rhizosphaerae TaxID=1836200 RepID=A0ABU8WX54_9BURK